MGGLGDREGPAVTTTTVDWLSARLDEDEERARGGAERFAADTDWGFIFRREVREVEAKRAIVADYADQFDAIMAMADRDVRAGKMPDGVEEAIAATGGLLAAVKYLAAVYADHPSYDPEWRP